MKFYPLVLIFLLGLVGCSSINQESARGPSSAYKTWSTGVIGKSDRGDDETLCKWAEKNGRDLAVKACQDRRGTTNGSIVDKRSCQCSDEECTVDVAIVCK